jgi:hypothetical protein
MSIRTSRDTENLLKGIDWSFSHRSTASLLDVRKYHWYPATFIPEIPFSLIEILSEPGNQVYDPFAGIGTAPLQAALLGRLAFGTELSRIAVMVARIVWSLLGSDVPLENLRSQLWGIAAEYKPSERYEEMFAEEDPRRSLLPAWFTTDTYKQLAYLASVRQQSSEPLMCGVLDLSVSSMLKSLSAQKGGSSWIGDNVAPKTMAASDRKDVFVRLDRVVRSLVRDFTRLRARLSDASREILSGASEEHLLRMDMTVVKDPPVPQAMDLLVTSPPYPNMTDYTTTQRLSYYWLGLRPEDDFKREIGARRKRFRQDSLSDYRSEMARAMEASVKCVRPGGYACFILPEFEGTRAVAERRRLAVQEVMANLPRHGLVLEHQLYRILPARRRLQNASWATLNRESIHIYRMSESVNGVRRRRGRARYDGNGMAKEP